MEQTKLFTLLENSLDKIAYGIHDERFGGMDDPPEHTMVCKGVSSGQLLSSIESAINFEVHHENDDPNAPWTTSAPGKFSSKMTDSNSEKVPFLYRKTYIVGERVLQYAIELEDECPTPQASMDDILKMGRYKNEHIIVFNIPSDPVNGLINLGDQYLCMMFFRYPGKDLVFAHGQSTNLTSGWQKRLNSLNKPPTEDPNKIIETVMHYLGEKVYHTDNDENTDNQRVESTPEIPQTIVPDTNRFKHLWTPDRLSKSAGLCSPDTVSPTYDLSLPVDVETALKIQSADSGRLPIINSEF